MIDETAGVAIALLIAVIFAAAVAFGRRRNPCAVRPRIYS